MGIRHFVFIFMYTKCKHLGTHDFFLKCPTVCEIYLIKLYLCSCRLKLDFLLVSHFVSIVIRESDYSKYAEMGCYKLQVFVVINIDSF